MPLTFRHHIGPFPARQGTGREPGDGISAWTLGAFLASLLVWCLLSSCATAAIKQGSASNPAAATGNPVWLTNQKSLTILPVSALGGRLDLRQQIEGEFQGQSYVMDTVIEADDTHFSLIALNGFGTQVFDLEYDVAGIRYESGLPIGSFKAEYLMADFQLCYFPAPAVKAMVEAAGLGFEEGGQGAGLRRTVRDGSTAIIEIERRDGVLHYRNLLRGYAYHITEEN